MAHCLKGCPRFDLWTDHSPLAQAMKKEVQELTPRMQKFREAIQAYKCQRMVLHFNIFELRFHKAAVVRCP